jgi:hypothetical protein
MSDEIETYYDEVMKEWALATDGKSPERFVAEKFFEFRSALAAETQRANEMAMANEQWLTKWKATSDTYSNLLADARRQALQECLDIASVEGHTSVIENKIYALIVSLPAAPSQQPEQPQ